MKKSGILSIAEGRDLIHAGEESFVEHKNKEVVEQTECKTDKCIVSVADSHGEAGP